MGKKKLICLLLTLLMLSGCFSNTVYATEDAVITKPEKTYDIAVAFDNSGSMYYNQAWCRAKYAMEIFASMLDYTNGDALKIFPMWEVTRDGSTPDTGGSFEGFSITSVSDIDQIHQLYTVNPNETPFEPIEEAYEYLKASDKSEKWLIVLTDGEFNQEQRNVFAEFNLQEKLEGLASSDINVQYLGFGGAQELKSNESKHFYAKKASDTSLKDDLVSICNSIFQRSVLESDKLQGDKLTLDLSMKNLIVFVQGSGASIDTLKNSSGEEIGILFDSGQRKFSTIKAKGFENAPVDESLAGQVVTFAACPKGEYTLSYSGADAIQVFYEPDVDVKLEFTDSYGDVIDLGTDDIVAGDYILNYGIVDNVTGEDATESGLLGDVDLKAWVVNADGEEVEIGSDGKVTLEPGEETYFKVEGTYLKDYKITTEDNKATYTFDVQFPSENELDIEAEVQQENNWYKYSDHEKWKPISVAVTMNGESLTDEQMAAIQWDIETKDITWYSEVIPGESALNIYVGYDEGGNYVKPDKGKYKFDIVATMDDEYGRPMKDKDSAKIEVRSYSAIWKWLKWILTFSVIGALIAIYMSKKVLPKDIDGRNVVFKVKGRNINPSGKIIYREAARTVSIKSASVPTDIKSECNISFALKPVDRRWTPSANRSIEIVDIQGAGMGVKKVTIGPKEYVKDKRTGRWVDADNPQAPIKQKVKNAFITIEANKASFDCQLIHK